MSTFSDDTTYGLDLHEYISPFGRVLIAYHRQFVGDIYSGHGLLLDPDKIVLRPLRGGKSSGNLAIRITHIEAPDEDTRKDEYLTECSLEFQSEKAHALLTGVTG
jgi:hypothetical protein